MVYLEFDADKPMRAENRNSERKSVDIECSITSRDGTFPGHILDLSSGGAFIQCKQDIQADERITLKFKLKEEDGTTEHSVKAVVAHRGRFVQGYENFNGFGIRFLDVPEVTGFQLKEIILHAGPITDRKYIMY